MIRFLKIAGILFVCILLSLAVKKIFFRTDKEVMNFVKGMNKTCPYMIDPQTRLDKVLISGNHNLQFNYTLVNKLKDSIPVPDLKRYMEPVILEKIKNSGTLRRFLNKNLTWIYSYSDKHGNFIFKVTYTPDQIKF